MCLLTGLSFLRALKGKRKTLPESVNAVRSVNLRKRRFDVLLVLFAAPIWLALFCIVGLLVLIIDGRPVFHIARRGGQNGNEFALFKFRTMAPCADDGRSRLTAGHAAWRVSALGRVLRRSRLDELPQLFNVLRGDMSLVGPRPPDPQHLALEPGKFAEILVLRPGLTGWGTVTLFQKEQALLAQCATAQEAETVYVQELLPQKLSYEHAYLERATKPRALFEDVEILFLSLKRVLTK